MMESGRLEYIMRAEGPLTFIASLLSSTLSSKRARCVIVIVRCHLLPDETRDDQQDKTREAVLIPGSSLSIIIVAVE